MHPFNKALLVFLGAGLGANARFWLGGWVQSRMVGNFPWGTMLINITGSLIIGLFVAMFMKLQWQMGWRLFVGVGILGGYTTFSSYSLETVELWQSGSYSVALGYVIASNLASILGCAAGLFVGQRLAQMNLI